MVKIETQTRKWGNSIGIAIPKSAVESEGLHENQRVIIQIKKAVDITRLRGLVKFKKSTQKLKDEMRAGWE